MDNIKSLRYQSDNVRRPDLAIVKNFNNDLPQNCDKIKLMFTLCIYTFASHACEKNEKKKYSASLKIIYFQFQF